MQPSGTPVTPESTTTNTEPVENGTLCAESVFATFHELHNLMKEYSRVHNFRLRMCRHEKGKDSGFFRGWFSCGGCNMKKAHGAKRAKEECTFFVPFTYLAGGEHRIKGVTGHYVSRSFELAHNHAIHGLLTVTDMQQRAVTTKRSIQQLTE